MGKRGFGKYARCVETRDQYIQRKNCNRLRGQLSGSASRFPKYPHMDYSPENSLYGLQGLGKLKYSGLI